MYVSVCVQKRVTLTEVNVMWVNLDTLTIGHSALPEKAGLTTFVLSHLLDVSVLIGTTIQAFCTSMFQFPLWIRLLALLTEQ